jgi:hypothetical protein
LPLSIPPFNQYQSPIVPLRGLWNAPPVEGDKFITAEIDWLVTTTQQAVQFAVSANSPVAFSQIVALAVDNSRSGADVDFVFSDSGFVLTVPALNQGVFPVFTNGLMFYAISQNAIEGDVTTFQVLNSMPPPTYINPSIEQNHASVSGIALTNGTTPVVPAGVNGTLNTVSIVVSYIAGAATEQASVNLIDGTGRLIWATEVVAAADAAQSIPFNLVGLALRFVNGLSILISSSSLTGGYIVANLYYSQP